MSLCLSRVVEGTGPTKPGNRLNEYGANSGGSKCPREMSIDVRPPPSGRWMFRYLGGAGKS